MPKKRGKRFVPYTFAVNPSLLKEVRQAAFDLDISVSRLIRDAIFHYKSDYEKKLKAKKEVKL